MAPTRTVQLTSLGAMAREFSRVHDRTLAIVTVSLLLSGVFDVGRALYCRYRLSYAVTQSASLLSRRLATPASNDPYALSTTAADLVRRMSGLTDLPRAAVRAHREVSAQTLAADAASAPRVMVTAAYTLPLLSPYARAAFRDGRLSIRAIAVQAAPSPFPTASALRSAT
jgi:hypothetical protein